MGQDGGGIDVSKKNETNPAFGRVGFVLPREIDTNTSGQSAGQPAGNSKAGGMGILLQS